MKCTIENTENGYMITCDADGETSIFCFEIDDIEEHGEQKAMYRMLWEVIDLFGMIGSKHDACRVRVKLEGIDEPA